MHYGWPSKEHQSVSRPLRQEKARESRAGEIEEPAALPLPAGADGPRLLQPGRAPPDEDGALSGALSTNHSNLRKVQITTLANGAEGVLKLVDEGNQVFHAPVPHGSVGSESSFLHKPHKPESDASRAD
ncbi:hypothetical protein EYF80_019390 [Liparis tanakae]|uniref:Uncharacterized protein n=1 Tax=Liparis tanakae TaxID=230148 RepID=A0A4Z2HZD5_9TELE|nr:hypothetical protein EYF80_019390 [Liparis tanakae]